LTLSVLFPIVVFLISSGHPWSLALIPFLAYSLILPSCHARNLSRLIIELLMSFQNKIGQVVEGEAAAWRCKDNLWDLFQNIFDKPSQGKANGSSRVNIGLRTKFKNNSVKPERNGGNMAGASRPVL
jgi:hypothetical protein